MTATLATTARTSARTTVRNGTGVRTSVRTSPRARPVPGGPTATPAAQLVPRRSDAVASCRVMSPAARRTGVVLRLKVSVVALVALVGIAVSAAEFSSWTEVDPALDYVAGDPAWAHVTGR